MKYLAILFLLVSPAFAETIIESSIYSNFGNGYVDGTDSEYLVITQREYVNPNWAGAIRVIDIATGFEIFNYSDSHMLQANIRDLDDDASEEVLIHGYTDYYGFVKVFDLETGALEHSATYPGRIWAYPLAYTNYDWCQCPEEPKYDILVNVTRSDNSGYAHLFRLFDAVSGVYGDCVPGLSVGNPYPNPFNPMTEIKYDLPLSSQVVIRVIDLAGRQIRLLDSGHKNSGGNAVVWDGRTDSGKPSSSGNYLVIIEAGDYTQTVGITLLK